MQKSRLRFVISRLLFLWAAMSVGMMYACSDENPEDASEEKEIITQVQGKGITDVWNKFMTGSADNVLLDFSYASYKHGEMKLALNRMLLSLVLR